MWKMVKTEDMEPKASPMANQREILQREFGKNDNHEKEERMKGLYGSRRDERIFFFSLDLDVVFKAFSTSK